jgi:hypothetical protein
MSPLPETLMLGKIYAILEAPGWSDSMPGPILGRGGRRVRQTCGELLPAHVYCNKEERWCGLLLGSILFWLVAPHLQHGVVVPKPFAAGGNRPYLELWVKAGGRQTTSLHAYHTKVETIVPIQGNSDANEVAFGREM